MMTDRSNDAPPTVRNPTTPTEQEDLADYVVRIVYREPGYALRSGTHRSYSGRFIVRATSLPAALSAAKSTFEHIAAQSGVRWVREIDSITGRRLEPGEPREGAITVSHPAGHAR
jgi:hypothetical protein